MDRFGIYIAKFDEKILNNKDYKGIKNSYVIGEVNLGAKKYRDQKTVDEICKARIKEEARRNNGKNGFKAEIIDRQATGVAPAYNLSGDGDGDRVASDKITYTDSSEYAALMRRRDEILAYKLSIGYREDLQRELEGINKRLQEIVKT